MDAYLSAIIIVLLVALLLVALLILSRVVATEDHIEHELRAISAVFRRMAGAIEAVNAELLNQRVPRDRP